MSLEEWRMRANELNTKTTLKKRESEVMAMKELGYKHSEIADLLMVEKGTIDTYPTRIKHRIERSRQTIDLLDSDYTISLCRGKGSYDPGKSEGDVGPDQTIFQGERGIQFLDPLKLPLIETSKDDLNEPKITSGYIPQDQKPGLYSTSGKQEEPLIRVATPKITQFKLFDSDGVTENPSIVDETILVKASWNFMEAEDVFIKVSDPDGFEVTNHILANSGLSNTLDKGLQDTSYEYSRRYLSERQQGIANTNLKPGQEAYWALDMSDLSPGDYSITVEGIKDLNFGNASKTVTVEKN